MAWYGWVLLLWLTPVVLAASYMLGLFAWECWQDAVAVKKYDTAFCREHKIDFSHTATPTFLGRRG